MKTPANNRSTMKTSMLSKALWNLNGFNKTSNKSGLLYFATVLSCEVKEESSIEQIATDGVSIFINPEWWGKQNVMNQMFGLAHEALHVQYMHVERLKGRDHKLWTIACDIYINALLLNDGFKPSKEIYITGADFNIYDPLKMTADQIYSELLKKKKQEKKEDKQGQGQEQLGKGQEGKTSKATKATKGSISTGGDMLPAKRTKEAAAAHLETIKTIAAGIGYDIKNLPDAFTQTYKELTAAPKDWKDECNAFVSRMRESVWSKSKPMPAYRARRQIMASVKHNPKLDFGFVIDTSGSIDPTIYGQFIATIRDAFTQLNPERMICILADDAIRSECEISVIPDVITFIGNGGTDFRPALERFDKEYPDIGGVIYLTDGYGRYPSEPPPYPILWAMTTDYHPPFGATCKI